MHSKPMADSDGTFAEWKIHPERCTRPIASESTSGVQRECGAVVRYRLWESSDGAYEDYQLRCENGHMWWVEGSDA